MHKFLIMLAMAMASVLAGCASTTPSCDGEDRRPINVPVKARVVYPSCGMAA